VSGYRDQHRQLLDMIEVVGTTIAINEREEDFYLRSAASSTKEAEKSLFLAIGDDIAQHLSRLRERRQRLSDGLRDLEAAEKRRKHAKTRRSSGQAGS
jgi:ribosomal protein S1